MKTNNRNISKSARFCLRPYKRNPALLEMFRNKWNRGFALIFAIFLVVGLETVIAGSMLGMMRLQREAQRSAVEMRLSWTADLVVEKTIKLLGDYMVLTGGFPVTGGDGKVLGGINTPQVNELTGGTHQNFDDYLMGWYGGGAGVPAQDAFKNKPHYQQALSQIDVPNVEIRETYRNEALHVATYSIVVTAQKVEGGIPTPFEVTVTQSVERNIIKLFDFAVFCSKDCEIAAGPSSTFPGPVFANGNIYLMNDALPGVSYNTLTLKLADTFFDPSKPNPEPYLMQATGNTYFYFKRFIGKNYLLGSSSVYYNSVPNYYKFKDPAPPANAQTVQTPVINPGYILDPDAENKHPPYFYYPFNGADCLSSSAGLGCQYNQIKMETAGGMQTIAPPLPKMWPETTTGSGFRLYSRAFSSPDDYAGATMSVSPGFDPAHLPLCSQADPFFCSPDPYVNPAWTDFWESTQYPSSYIEPYLIKDDVAEPRRLELGHLIIEPLIPGEPADVAAQKFHQKAHFKLVQTGPSQSDKSLDFRNFETEGILTSADPSADYRNKTTSGGKYNFYSIVYTLNIAELLDYLDTLNPPLEKIVIYFSHVDPKLNSLRIINGSRLPEKGLTIAGDGRIYIQGDYNTYSYTKGPGNSCASSGYPSRCHCTEEEWDDGNCRVPPAAIFSDNFGVLSKEWKTRAEGYVGCPSPGTFCLSSVITPLSSRKVTQNVMVNTALATGLIPSRLVKLIGEDYCTDERFCLGDITCVPRPTGRNVHPNTSGELFRPSSPDGLTYRCGGNTYAQGRTINDPSCEYYRESSQSDDIYHYYLNPKSGMYLIARARQGSTLPCTLVGDINGHYGVGGDDSIIVTKTKGQCCGSPSSGCPSEAASCPILPADLDGDNRVGDPDYAIWRAHFGEKDPPNCLDNVRIPIFADPNTVASNPPTAVPPFAGVAYTELNRSELFGYACTEEATRLPCTDGKTVQSVPSSCTSCTLDCSDQVTCPPNVNKCCDPGGDNCVGQLSSPYCTAISPLTGKNPPQVAYLTSRRYAPLYRAAYSGGLENLIGLQEDWYGQTLRFLGTFSILWDAEELAGDYGANPAYYRAPERKFDYNEDLRSDRPPGTPDLSSVKRLRWSREF